MLSPDQKRHRTVSAHEQPMWPDCSYRSGNRCWEMGLAGPCLVALPMRIRMMLLGYVCDFWIGILALCRRPHSSRCLVWKVGNRFGRALRTPDRSSYKADRPSVPLFESLGISNHESKESLRTKFLLEGMTREQTETRGR